MKIVNSLGRFGAEVARAVRNLRYELTETGMYLPASKMYVGGAFRHTHFRADGSVDTCIDPNRVVKEGINYLLAAAFAGGSQITNFYLAAFSGNVTPDTNWTGANFVANSTEFTDYTAANRLPWTVVTPTNQSVGNSAAIPAATMTLKAGGPYNIYGLGLLEAQAKGAVTGKLVAATRFANPRLGLPAGDKLGLEYIISAKDVADV